LILLIRVVDLVFWGDDNLMSFYFVLEMTTK